MPVEERILAKLAYLLKLEVHSTGYSSSDGTLLELRLSQRYYHFQVSIFIPNHEVYVRTGTWLQSFESKNNFLQYVIICLQNLGIQGSRYDALYADHVNVPLEVKWT
jgi:hypothetical protein